MNFWDSSAVLGLLIHEVPSWKLWELFRRDPGMVLWWATPVECVSALTRFEREGRPARTALDQAWAGLRRLQATAHQVQPAEEVRSLAEGLLLKHPLRAADALQLAAGLLWSEERPRRAGFVALDHRLRTAAAREGFQLFPFVDEVHETPAEWEIGAPSGLSRVRLPGI